MVKDGTDVALFALGAMVEFSLQAAEILESNEISCAVVNARFAKPVDWRALSDWLARVPLVITLEDHALQGGFGSAMLEAASDHGLDAGRIRRIGVPDRFIEHGNRHQLLEKLGLNPEGLARSINQFIQKIAVEKVPVESR
tara:strand:- start:743 stop:1165 length:423 start_codon:yes stop_codon:yes gene_type:complete